MKNDLPNMDEQSTILEQTTYANNYTAFIPWSKSIGLKLHSFRYQEQQAFIRIAEDFLANISFNRNDIESECSLQAYFDDIGQTMLSLSGLEDNDHFEKIPLPKTAPLKMSLERTIANRRSIRQYTGDSISMSYLSSILKTAYGVTTNQEVNIGKSSSTTMSYRTTPSAGGIYPNELYIVALNVTQLAKGIYQYNAHEDCLVKLFNQDDVEKLLNCFSVQEDHISIRRSSFLCLLIGSAHKSMHKYGNRGLGFTLHEAGAISQNIHLAVTALGVGSVDCASYFNDEAHKILGLDGIYRHLLHSIIIGVCQ